VEEKRTNATANERNLGMMISKVCQGIMN